MPLRFRIMLVTPKDGLGTSDSVKESSASTMAVLMAQVGVRQEYLLLLLLQALLCELGGAVYSQPWLYGFVLHLADHPRVLAAWLYDSLRDDTLEMPQELQSDAWVKPCSVLETQGSSRKSWT
eukprot:CAMPEP_0197650162 /NCGR_PEP_ID=MMETSP1338-20131121/30777_1 /TAXON_ID=43686 ORGANISM="Pelagodinium beii, Strain RCC1491" /NCGR_SAMPLE_ID=MMETSP1338 /ASSEMBLY_ACC=CAM_ASM_000754 /LENGTH=122 /DNA_ID=CAMNT_0043224515 /DNA_START=338 /DNA_END=707 /DNA_ORIENTATION=+